MLALKRIHSSFNAPQTFFIWFLICFPSPQRISSFQSQAVQTPIAPISLSRLTFSLKTRSRVSSSSPLLVVSYRLYELPVMRSSGKQTSARGRRRQGLDWGKCPHPSFQYRALSGAKPPSAAGRCPGAADGGRGRGSVYLNVCFLKLNKLLPPVFFSFFF